MGATQSSFLNQHVDVELDVQKDKMGLLIGVKGAKIKALKQQSAADIIVTPLSHDSEDAGNKFDVVTVRGKAKDVYHSCGLVDDVVEVANAYLMIDIEAGEGNYLTPLCADLEQQTSCLVKIAKRYERKYPGEYLAVTAEGFLNDVANAFHAIMSALEKYHEQSAAAAAATTTTSKKEKPRMDRHDMVSKEIEVSPKLAASLASSKFELLNKLRSETRAQIYLDITRGLVKLEGTQFQTATVQTQLEELEKELEETGTISKFTNKNNNASNSNSNNASAAFNHHHHHHHHNNNNNNGKKHKNFGQSQQQQSQQQQSASQDQQLPPPSSHQQDHSTMEQQEQH